MASYSLNSWSGHLLSIIVFTITETLLKQPGSGRWLAGLIINKLAKVWLMVYNIDQTVQAKLKTVAMAEP